MPSGRQKEKLAQLRTYLQETNIHFGVTGFEPATFCPPDKRATAALHPDVMQFFEMVFLEQMVFGIESRGILLKT